MGITVVPVDLSEILSAAKAVDSNSTGFKQKIQELRDYGTIAASVPETNIAKQVSFTVAVENWIKRNMK